MQSGILLNKCQATNSSWLSPWIDLPFDAETQVVKRVRVGRLHGWPGESSTGGVTPTAPPECRRIGGPGVGAGRI